MAPVPVAHEVGGLRALGVASSVTGAPSTRTRLKTGTARSPCSPSTHASTAAAGTPSDAAIEVRSRSDVVERVADDPPPVAQRARQARGQRVDRVGDHHHDAVPAGQARGDPVDDRAVVLQVDGARRVRGQRRRRAHDEHVDAVELLPRAGRDRERRRRARAPARGPSRARRPSPGAGRSRRRRTAPAAAAG